MRRINLILLLLGMLMAVGIVEAQGEEIVVAYSTCCSSDNTPIFAETFMETLQAQLSEFDVSVTLVQHFDGRDIPDEALVDVHFYEVFDGEHVIVDTGITIKVQQNVLAEVSTILEGQVTVALRESNDTTIDYSSAITLYASGKGEDAYTLLNSTTPLEDNLENARIQILYGNIEILLGNYDLAKTHLEIAATELASNGFVYNASYINLAWVYVTLGEAERGIDFLSSYIEQMFSSGMGGEGLSHLWVKRAQLYALAFDYDSAIADMDKAITLAEENVVDNTTLAELYTIRGQIIFLIYEWDRVLADFNHAIELDPNYAPAYFQRGVLYYTMTQRENALVDFEHYLELEPDGLYAEEAAQYIESIHIELEALGG